MICPIVGGQRTTGLFLDIQFLLRPGSHRLVDETRNSGLAVELEPASRCLVVNKIGADLAMLLGEEVGSLANIRWTMTACVKRPSLVLDSDGWRETDGL